MDKKRNLIFLLTLLSGLFFISTNGHSFNSSIVSVHIPVKQQVSSTESYIHAFISLLGEGTIQPSLRISDNTSLHTRIKKTHQKTPGVYFSTSFSLHPISYYNYFLSYRAFIPTGKLYIAFYSLLI